ncbi:MAG: YkgJ family cysteine cluster protein [Planctomycetota bacterium]
MAEHVLTMAGGNNGGASGKYTRTQKVIGLEFDALGETLNFDIEVGIERAKLADIVPLARTLCTNITDIVVHQARSNGDRIPCDKGCSACCSRCLVPLSVPEALRFKEEIDAAPTYQREYILGACLKAARLILNQKPPKSFKRQTKDSQSKSVDLNHLSNWYMSMKLSCPFLYNRVCSIYDQRPLACREHYITGSARVCKGLRGDAEVLDMPVQLPNVLGQLASELESTDVEAVILPLAPAWYEENSERAERSWPAEMMVNRFVEIVEATVQRNCRQLPHEKQAIIEFSRKRQVTNRLYQSL